MKILILLSFSFFSIELLEAQQIRTSYSGPCQNCNAIIVQDQINNSTSIYQEVHFYQSIDQETFNQLKKENSSGINLKLINISNDWNEFQQNLQKLKQEVRYDETYRNNAQLSSYTYNNQVYTSWSKCVSENCSKADFVAWVDKEDDKEITIKMIYRYKGNGAPPKLKVRAEVTQNNGPKKREDFKINPEGESVYSIPRVYGNDGKSYVSFKIQPLDKAGDAVYDALNGTSAFFTPTLAINNISIDFIEVKRVPLYSKSNLYAPNYEENKIPDLVRDKVPIGIASCDRKYFAVPLDAVLQADEGCYFEDFNNLDQITFDASGPGAGWNQGALRGDCKAKCAIITYATPTLIKVKFAGSASKETTWSVYRFQTKTVNQTRPVAFYYLSKDLINFTIPLSLLKENFNINVSTMSSGNIILDKTSPNYIYKDDPAAGIRNYTLDLKKIVGQPNNKNSANFFIE